MIIYKEKIMQILSKTLKILMNAISFLLLYAQYIILYFDVWYSHLRETTRYCVYFNYDCFSPYIFWPVWLSGIALYTFVCWKAWRPLFQLHSFLKHFILLLLPFIMGGMFYGIVTLLYFIN